MIVFRLRERLIILYGFPWKNFCRIPSHSAATRMGGLLKPWCKSPEIVEKSTRSTGIPAQTHLKQQRSGKQQHRGQYQTGG